MIGRLVEDQQVGILEKDFQQASRDFSPPDSTEISL